MVKLCSENPLTGDILTDRETDLPTYRLADWLADGLTGMATDKIRDIAGESESEVEGSDGETERTYGDRESIQ